MNVNMYKHPMEYLQKMGHWTILRIITVSQNWNAGDVSCKCNASLAKPPLENDANHNSRQFNAPSRWNMLLEDDANTGGLIQKSWQNIFLPWCWFCMQILHREKKSRITEVVCLKPKNLTNVCLTSTSHVVFHIICHPLSRLLVTICRIKSPSFGSGWNEWNRVLGEFVASKIVFTAYHSNPFQEKNIKKLTPNKPNRFLRVFVKQLQPQTNFPPCSFNPHTSKPTPTTLCCRQATAKRLMKVLLRSKPWVWWCTGSCRKKRRCRPVVELICRFG